MYTLFLSLLLVVGLATSTPLVNPQTEAAKRLIVRTDEKFDFQSIFQQGYGFLRSHGVGDAYQLQLVMAQSYDRDGASRPQDLDFFYLSMSTSDFQSKFVTHVMPANQRLEWSEPEEIPAARDSSELPTFVVNIADILTVEQAWAQVTARGIKRRMSMVQLINPKEDPWTGDSPSSEPVYHFYPHEAPTALYYVGAKTGRFLQLSMSRMSSLEGGLPMGALNNSTGTVTAMT